MNNKLDISFVCEYLRIYSIDDEQILLEAMIEASYSYLDNAIDNFYDKYNTEDGFKSLADIVILAMISEMYDNRVYTKHPKYDQQSKMVTSLITQLQLY